MVGGFEILTYLVENYNNVERQACHDLFFNMSHFMSPCTWGFHKEFIQQSRGKEKGKYEI